MIVRHHHSTSTKEREREQFSFRSCVSIACHAESDEARPFCFNLCDDRDSTT